MRSNRIRKTRRIKARYAWDRLRVSFWFAPLIMSVGAVLLAWAMNWVDVRIPNEMLEYRRLVLSGTTGELRNILVEIATTTLATAGVVFTLLTLPLSTVAAQYGSRLIRVFMGDRTTQLVLSMFVSTFVYCMAAAASISPDSPVTEGPQVTATIGMFLMLATFASLILLIQHISTMLQAPKIAAAAGAELLEVIQAEIPEYIIPGDGSQTRKEAIAPQAVESTAAVESTTRVENSMMETEGYPLRVWDTGYIQYIDPDILLTLANEKNLVIRLLYKPGHFVGREAVVAMVWPAEGRENNGWVDMELEEQITHAFQIGNRRTPTQDVVYAVNQLVEMGVRAMSPAINDPFTAMTCLDYIGEGLALFMRQGEKCSQYYDQDGKLRLVLIPVNFEELLNAAFDMYRHASSDNASVLLHMLEVIDTISRAAKPPTVKNNVERRQELLRHVSLIQAESQAGRLIEADRQNIQQRCIALQEKLRIVQGAD